MCMGDGIEFDPENLRRVWGQVLPIASDYYDNAIERTRRGAPAYNRLRQDHLYGPVEGAWRDAISGDGATLDLLRHMQDTLLAAADGVRVAMGRYAATDLQAGARLDAAHDTAVQTTAPHTVELDL
jgi:hypothetical protein